MKEVELWRRASSGIRQRHPGNAAGSSPAAGTGKTALARLAEDLNMPIYVFNLAEVSDFDLLRWVEMRVNVPCIALIEDIDSVFHSRENIALER